MYRPRRMGSKIINYGKGSQRASKMPILLLSVSSRGPLKSTCSILLEHLFYTPRGQQLQYERQYLSIAHEPPGRVRINSANLHYFTQSKTPFVGLCGAQVVPQTAIMKIITKRARRDGLDSTFGFPGRQKSRGQFGSSQSKQSFHTVINQEHMHLLFTPSHQIHSPLTPHRESPTPLSKHQMHRTLRNE